jgi:hypothetical protein
MSSRKPTISHVRHLAAFLLALGTITIVTTGLAAAAEPASPGTEAPASLQLTPREQALEAILDEGRVRVAALVTEMQADPARSDEIQREICRIKADANVRFLQAQVDFARADGNEAQLLKAQQALDNAVNPPVAVPAMAMDKNAGVAK